MTRRETHAAAGGSVGALCDDAPLRVMVVDDSRVVRSIVTGWLAEEPGMRVVAAHGDGRSAADDVARTASDVVVLDIEMPGMDGLTALPLILRARPSVRVLVASTLTRRGAAISLEALTLGAADYVAKPGANLSGDAGAFRTELITKIRVLGESVRRRAAGQGVRAGARPAVRDAASRHDPAGPPRSAMARHVAPASAAAETAQHRRVGADARAPGGRPAVVLVASSTGGPQALMALFRILGPAMGATPVLVAQHMPATFTAILAEHIARVSGRPAREGVDGEPLRRGEIRVAPGGRHMTVVRGPSGPRIALTDDPPVNFCRPSADVLFLSAREVFARDALALVLTGMGSDGANGARAIFEAGGAVIVQDEASSVVWGMPKAVLQAGAATETLPLERIGPRAAQLIGGGGDDRRA